MIDTSNIQLSIAPTEISEIVRLAEGSIRQRLQPGVTLNVVLGASECTIPTDRNLMSQILMNLLVNAAKFTPRGAITFGYEIYEDEIYFFVKDSGCGLTSEKKDRLIALFEEDDVHSPGLGFGMPMVNAMVKQLGGNVGVESRGPGRGCTFWFTVPYNTETSDEAATEAPKAEDEVVEKSSDMITILVAEDNDSNYLLFHTILKQKYNVLRAVDGVEAIEMFKKHQPDLILMDLNMPNVDGYEATREIRKISADVPIIAATAYAFVTDRRRIIENGFNGYVSKPINMSRLEQEIANCLGK